MLSMSSSGWATRSSAQCSWRHAKQSLLRWCWHRLCVEEGVPGFPGRWVNLLSVESALLAPLPTLQLFITTLWQPFDLCSTRSWDQTLDLRKWFQIQTACTNSISQGGGGGFSLKVSPFECALIPPGICFIPLPLHALLNSIASPLKSELCVCSSLACRCLLTLSFPIFYPCHRDDLVPEVAHLHHDPRWTSLMLGQAIETNILGVQLCVCVFFVRWQFFCMHCHGCFRVHEWFRPEHLLLFFVLGCWPISGQTQTANNKMQQGSLLFFVHLLGCSWATKQKTTTTIT